jgi:hypothetical protein
LNKLYSIFQKEFEGSVKMGVSDKIKGCEIVDPVYLAHDRIKLWALISTAVNISVP